MGVEEGRPDPRQNQDIQKRKNRLAIPNTPSIGRGGGGGRKERRETGRKDLSPTTRGQANQDASLAPQASPPQPWSVHHKHEGRPTTTQRKSFCQPYYTHYGRVTQADQKTIDVQGPTNYPLWDGQCIFAQPTRNLPKPRRGWWRQGLTGELSKTHPKILIKPRTRVGRQGWGYSS